jgi:hypothetical protein
MIDGFSYTKVQDVVTSTWAGKKWAKSDAIDTGEAHAVTIGGIPSLERFQVDPYGKSRIIEAVSARTMTYLFSFTKNLDGGVPCVRN